MREFYHHELQELLGRVVFYARQVASAVELAGTALLRAEPTAAQGAISMTEDIHRWLAELDDRAIELIIRQQPVAGDLRTIVAAMRMGTALQRMGTLAVHIAEIAQARLPEHVVSPVLLPSVAELASATAKLVARAIQIVETQDVQAALELDCLDDEVDRLQDSLYRAVLIRNHEIGSACAMDVALIGRYYERIADHAVSIARYLGYRAGEVTLD